SISFAQFAIRRLEAERSRRANDCWRENGLEIVAAAVSAAWFEVSQATRLPLELLRDESAVDVAFQMRDCGLLAGGDMLHQITDGDHADHLLTVKHRQMANVLVGHQPQACLDALTRMRGEHIC